MRIAFVGKGGSGKTTLTALYAQWLAARTLPVLAIDADINQHLAESLGMDAAKRASIPPLGLEVSRIKEFFRGSNPLIESVDSMVKTTPPGRGSQLIRFNEKNPIHERFCRKIGHVNLMATGPFSEEDLGISCYHSKTGAVELYLNHLLDGPDEFVLLDMTAGADSFASGMFTKFDTTVLVVEPTLKSVSVFKQYSDYAKEYGVNICAVGNKVESKEDEDFLTQQLGSTLITRLTKSPYIKNLEKGQFQPIELLEKENLSSIAQMHAFVTNSRRDWNKLLEQTKYFHVKNAVSWANAQTGKDLTQQIDPEFTYPAAPS